MRCAAPPQRLIVLVLCSVACAAWARPPNERAQVAAATEDAVRSLRAEVLSERLSDGRSLRQFLESIDGLAEFTVALRGAQQIGGPRWIDEQTVQVRLQIGGEDLSQMLVNMVSGERGGAGISPEALSRELGGWRSRMFSATGTSIGPSRLKSVRPLAIEKAWAEVDEGARQSAVAAARSAAAAQILAGLGDVPAGEGITLAQMLGDPEVGGRLTAWLCSQPVTDVHFGDDLRVELRLGVGADELAGQIERLTDFAGDPDALAARVASCLAESVGRAWAAPRAVVPTAGRRARLAPPESFAGDAPEWVNQPLQTVARASFNQSRLRTRADAEGAALEMLRARVGSLQLAPGRTLEGLIADDPAAARAVARAMSEARVSKVDYDLPYEGDVTVRVTLDSRLLWSELTGSAGR